MKKLTVSEDSNSDAEGGMLFDHATQTRSDLRLQLFFHLIPIIGFFPSLWTLYRHAGVGSREEREKGDKGDMAKISPLTTHYSLLTTHSQKEKLAVSRLSVTLALSWLLAYFLLGAGAETSEFLNFRLLMLNSLLTSGYFLVSLWLMLRLTTGKSVRLAGFSALADRSAITPGRSAEGNTRHKLEP